MADICLEVSAANHLVLFRQVLRSLDIASLNKRIQCANGRLDGYRTFWSMALALAKAGDPTEQLEIN
jgi:hypothetical protein